MSASTDVDKRVLSVAEFTRQLKDVVENVFPAVWVGGEISNFSRPQSGHCYFTLKDDQAQLRAVIWKGVAARLRHELQDGQEVVCRGRIDVYPPRGSYQLVVDKLELQGVGALEAALRKLRDKLEREGLFRSEGKRPLPSTPRCIGVVTSPTGAAVRDFLQVLKRRWGGVGVRVFPTRVQGEGAAAEIVAAINAANRVVPRLDVLVVTRGGGSLEDLWCFNDERVVRAIAASTIPTISAVGHEIDVTLADLAADVRALTPSEAAERVAPSSEDMDDLLRSFRSRLDALIHAQLSGLRSQLDGIASRPSLSRPFDLVNLLARRVDETSLQLHRAANAEFQARQHRLAAVAAKLDALSPLSVLGRGYSVTMDAKSNKTITSASQLQAGGLITTRFSQGMATSRVERLSN